MRHYYNEHDPNAAAWLRELIAAGHLPAGDVDGRDIQLVQPADLAGYASCHFFAGIGGWPYALRLAEWDGSVWTGSCPCQPFSDAGKKAGLEDSRHLWPAWFRLIRECRPPIVFGEQVASRDGLAWFDHVSADMEAEGYAVGAADLCAAGSGAPHIRQRLFFVAISDSRECAAGWQRRPDGGAPQESPGLLLPRRLDDSAGSGRSHGTADAEAAGQGRAGVVEAGDSLRLADSDGERRAERAEPNERAEQPRQPASRRGDAGGRGWMDDAQRHGRRARGNNHRGDERQQPSPASHPWADLVWFPCRDGKYRPAPAEPALFPLAPRLPGRVGLLRGAGNAIVPQVAAQFVRAYREVIP